MKIAVIGTGAMGSIYAGLLADAGNEVWAIDSWQEHIDAIRTDGLRVEGASGDRTVRNNLHASTAVDDAGSCDLMVIATKAHDVANAAQAIKGFVTDNTLILAMQNGLGAADRMKAYLPNANILLGIGGGFGASIQGPGHTHHNGMAMINIGEMSGGRTERVEQVVHVWAEAGFNARAFDNIDQLVWEKLICNCSVSAPCTVFGRTVGEVLDDPHSREISLRCGFEAWEAGRARGVPFSFDDPEAHILNFANGVLNARPSMLQDHMARRRSEIDFINGAIPEVAVQVGTLAPYNEVVSAIVRSREAEFV
ncbi:MAG: 2-dehydropantoate 2-reductase [Chloroflexota bacterium]